MVVGEGPEYETVWAFSGHCGIFLDAIHAANMLYNNYGIDTISRGNINGWAMELYKRALITDADPEGVSLTLGNHKAIVDLHAE